MMATRAHQRGRRGMLMMAISGIDIALWDIVGQATRTPLYQLLGGYRDTLEAYASAGFYARDKGPAELAEEFGGYAARGLRFGKLKGGNGRYMSAAAMACSSDSDRPSFHAASNTTPSSARRPARALSRWGAVDRWERRPHSPPDCRGAAP
jgi:L-alanine-DL-glutamate epimerase-like enolase superfamily enzyme